MVLAIAIELSMVIAFGVLMLAPRWRLVAFTPTTDRGVAFLPEAWSPDAGALITGTPGRFVVLGSNGSVLQGPDPGWSPVWINDRNLMILNKEWDRSTYDLVRMEAGGGHRETIGQPLGQGHLIADGRGHVAYQSDDAPVDTTVLDVSDGNVLAKLDGHGAVTWTGDGALIVKRPEPRLGGYTTNPGSLWLWRPGEAPNPLGPDLVDMGNVAPLSPTGDALACICTVVPATPEAAVESPPRAIYLVPLDGSPRMYLAPWPTQGGASPEITWIDETSLAVVGDDGIWRISASGGSRPIPGLAAADLGFGTMVGRVYSLRGQTVAVLQELAGGVESLLVVIDPQDGIRMRQWFPGNMPAVTVDPAQERAVVSVERQRPEGPSLWDILSLELR